MKLDSTMGVLKELTVMSRSDLFVASIKSNMAQLVAMLR
jgi:hypothetical protein